MTSVVWLKVEMASRTVEALRVHCCGSRCIATARIVNGDIVSSTKNPVRCSAALQELTGRVATRAKASEEARRECKVVKERRGGVDRTVSRIAYFVCYTMAGSEDGLVVTTLHGFGSALSKRTVVC